MARRVFFSFHYSNDFWRVQQVRNIKALEGQPIYSASDWEEIKRKGKSAIEKWIDDNMRGTSCVVVLVGAETASRPWVLHEISKGWNDGKGVLGIRIDRLLDSQGRCSPVGENPLSRVKFSDSQRTLAEFAQLKAPSGPDSKSVYTAIVDNIEAWIEEAVQIRRRA